MPQDPTLYLLAIPAVLLVGLAKGGFSGAGALGLPLFALAMDPVQAAGILLPILIAQDVVSVAAFRRTWDGHVLAIMLPGAVIGVVLGWWLAASVSRAVLVAVGAISMTFGLYRLWVERGGRSRVRLARLGRRLVWRRDRLHQPDRACRRPAVPDLGDAAAAGARRAGRDDSDLLRGAQLDQGSGLCRARPVQLAERVDDAGAAPVRIARQPGGVFLVRRISMERFCTIIYVLMIIAGAKLLWDGLAP